MAKKILITGGSGWLAQFVYAQLKEDFSSAVDIHVTYNSKKPSSDWIENSHAHKIDLGDEAAVSAFIETFMPDVVIHLAALSSPGVCEKVSFWQSHNLFPCCLHHASIHPSIHSFIISLLDLNVKYLLDLNVK